MALNTKYVVGINLNDYFVDKDTGLPLAGGKIYLKKDNNRSVGKFAYRLTGSPPNYTYTELPNPIPLSSFGTVAVSENDTTNVAVYFYPYDENGNLDLYYIYVTDADDNTQLERQAWPNVGENVNPLNEVSGESDNQILNSQFVDVNFLQEEGILLEWTGAISNRIFPIGPGWDMIVSASDTSSIKIDRQELVGSLNVNTNPPYALEVLPQGGSISSIKLRQKLDMNPSIWANNSLSGFMLIASLDSFAHTIEMTYSTSVPNIPQTIISASTGLSGYVSAAGVLNLTPSTNTNTPPEGFTFIDILLPRTGHVLLSSVQVLPTLPNGDPASYIQNTVNRQQSELFNYYNPIIQKVAVPSLAVGWDFKMNPAQWGANQTMTTEKSKYIWDQTIVWQSIDNLMSFYRNNAYEFRCDLATTGQFALVQYLTGAEMQALFSDGWSVLLDAYTTVPGGTSGQVSFWYTEDATLPDISEGTNLSIINTLDAFGKPALFNGAWTELKNSSLGNARFTIDQGQPQEWVNRGPKIALNGWERPSSYDIPTNATYVAIVVGFSSSSSGAVVFNSIAVTPGKQSRPVAPLTYEATLQHLRKYWEQSYEAGVAPGTPNALQSLIAVNSTSQYFNSIHYFIPIDLEIHFKSPKISLPNLIFYNPYTGASNQFACADYYLSGAPTGYHAATVFTNYMQPLYLGHESVYYAFKQYNASQGINGTFYFVSTNLDRWDYAGVPYFSTNPKSPERNLLSEFHYTADSRLGTF